VNSVVSVNRRSASDVEWQGKLGPKRGDGAAPVALEKRTSVAEAVKARLFTARLKPCPSLDGLFPGLLWSPKASCTGQIGQCERSNLEFSPAPAVCSRAMNSNCQRSAHLQRDALGAPLFIAHQMILLVHVRLKSLRQLPIVPSLRD
jgi:hypothetical protein